MLFVLFSKNLIGLVGMEILCIFMPPTLKKRGAYCFGLSVRPFVCPHKPLYTQVAINLDN